MPANHFKNTFQHMDWADATVWTTVLAAPAATADVHLAKTLFHIHETHHAFLNAWEGKPLERFKYESFDSLKSIHHWGLAFYAKLPGFMDSVSDENINEPCVLPWAKYFGRALGHDPEVSTLGDTLQQVPSHTMHHRGQVLRRLRELEIQPPTIDYIVWVWSGKPTANHPSTS